MRISDWSSDVCSSDLHEDADRDDADDLRPQSAAEDADREGAPDAGNQVGRDGADDVVDLQLVQQRYRDDEQGAAAAAAEQGRARVQKVGACGDGDEAGAGTV